MGKGFIVAAGGNLCKNQEIIYKAFIEKAGGENAKIAVFVVSSEIPIESFVSVQNEFIRLGVNEKNIDMVPLTYLKSLISKGWYKSGNDPELLTYLNNTTGIWFVGGNQMCTTKTMLNDYYSDTILLKTIRRLHHNGVVIGGTSAGASVLGNPMIGGGTDLGAISMPIYYDENEYEAKDLNDIGQVLLTKGFGLYEFGIIDQHFDTRPRLQRVIKVMEEINQRDAIGIDEDTAIICDCETGHCSVIGAGRVTVINNYDSNITIKRFASGSEFSLNKSISES